MLYKDFLAQDLECDSCPLYRDGHCKGGMYADHNGQPIEPPCVYFEDDTDLEEECYYMLKAQNEAELRQMKRWQAEKEKAEKNRIAQEKRRLSKIHVHYETQAIKQLKKQIEAIHSVTRFRNAMSFASNMMDNTNLETDNINPKIVELEYRIKELEAIKKQKLKEFKKNNGWL